MRKSLKNKNLKTYLMMSLISVYKKSSRLLFKYKFLIIALIPIIIDLLFNHALSFSLTTISDSLQPALFALLTSGDFRSGEFLEPVVSAVQSRAYYYLLYFTVYALIMPLIISYYYNGSLSALNKEGLSLKELLRKSFSRLGRFYAALLVIALFLSLPFTLLLLYNPLILLIPFIEFFLLILLFYALPAISLENGGFRRVFSYAWFVGRSNLWRSVSYLALSVIIVIIAAFFLRPLPAPYNIYAGMLILIPLLSISHAVLYLQGVKRSQVS